MLGRALLSSFFRSANLHGHVADGEWRKEPRAILVFHLPIPSTSAVIGAMGYEDPATEKQLAYLLKFGYTPPGPLTRGEASNLIEQFSEDPERCNIRDAKQMMVEHEEATAWNLHTKVNQARADPEEDLEFATGQRLEFWAGTFNVVKAEGGQGLEFHMSHGRLFEVPSEKQIQEILDALDAQMPEWDRDNPDLFYQTLELNHPELRGVEQNEPTESAPLERLPTSSYRAMLDEVASTMCELSRYDSVAAWHERAKECQNAIIAAANAIDVEMRPLDHDYSSLESQLARAVVEFKSQPLLKRVFGKHDSEASIEARIGVVQQQAKKLKADKAQLVEFSTKIQDYINYASEFAPRTPAEKSSILKRMRLKKKELQSQKHEATAAMTAIRQEARVASAEAGKNWIGLYDSELAARQRRGIRHAKEATLSPLESTKEEIEAQLIAIEKRVLFVERFE